MIPQTFADKQGEGSEWSDFEGGVLTQKVPNLRKPRGTKPRSSIISTSEEEEPSNESNRKRIVVSETDSESDTEISFSKKRKSL